MGTVVQESRSQKASADNRCYNWDLLGEEVPQFVYEYFTHALTPMDKLIFYGYFITGFTNVEIAERVHQTHQYVSARIMRIERLMKYLWERKEKWSEYLNGSRTI